MESKFHFGPSLIFGYDVQQTELSDCKCISKLSQRRLQAFSMWSQSWPHLFQASRWSQYCPRVVSKFFKVVSIFFFKIVVIIMTDKSRGLSRTVLSDQLGRQRRLTLKSQPPIHKMQPISLLHFFFTKTRFTRFFLFQNMKFNPNIWGMELLKNENRRDEPLMN